MIKQKFHVCCAKGNPWISEDVDTVSIRDLDNIPLAIPEPLKMFYSYLSKAWGSSEHCLCIRLKALYCHAGPGHGRIGIVCISDIKDLAAQDVFVRPLVDIEGEESGNVSADRYVIVSTEYPLSSATAHFY